LVTCYKEGSEQVFQTQITPPAFLEPVTIELPSGIGTRKRQISLELSIDGREWKLGYHKRNVYRESFFALVSGYIGRGRPLFYPGLRIER
jgi:hypothetical protein